MNLIRLKNGKTKLIQSKRYYEYKSEVVLQLMEIMDELEITEPIKDQVNLKCVFYRKDKRRCDLVNLLNSIQDILVESGVLEDDNYKIINSVDGSCVRYDKENPRVEIEITKKKGE